MKNIILITVISLIISCSNSSNKKYENLISSDDMVKILTSIHLTVSELNTFQYQGDFSEFHVDSLLSSSYLELGYSEYDFKKSWDYYTSNDNIELLAIYDKVLQEIQLMEEQAKN